MSCSRMVSLSERLQGRKGAKCEESQSVNSPGVWGGGGTWSFQRLWISDTDEHPRTFICVGIDSSTPLSGPLMGLDPRGLNDGCTELGGNPGRTPCRLRAIEN